MAGPAASHALRMIAGTPPMRLKADSMKPEATNQWPTANQLPASTIEPPAPSRDEHGRFLTGNSGGGRPKGSRNKISETFLETIAKDFIDHGAEAIIRLREEDPACYLRLIAWLIPRDVILK